MTIPEPETVTSRDQARDLAIEWQVFFAGLAERFGLTEEFAENAII